MNDTVPLIGQINSLGLSGSMAGTAFSAMLRQMNKADVREKLGFDLVKKDDGTLDVVGTLQSLDAGLLKLKKTMSDDEIKEALATAFGDEGLRATSLLLDNIDGVADGLVRVNENAKGVVDTNFSEWAEITKSSINRISDSFDNLKASFLIDMGGSRVISSTLDSSANAIRSGAAALFNRLIGDDSIIKEAEEYRGDATTPAARKAIQEAGGFENLRASAIANLPPRPNEHITTTPPLI